MNKDDISSSEVTPNGFSVITACLLRFGGDPGELMAEEPEEEEDSMDRGTKDGQEDGGGGVWYAWQ